MSEDLISRQAAINAINSWFEIAKHPMNRGAYNNGELAAYSTAISEIENLPSAEPERIIYANMSDEEFEKWLYEHGICNPDIHDSIPCSAVPMLIDNAISYLPSAEPEWIPVSDRLPVVDIPVLVTNGSEMWVCSLFESPDLQDGEYQWEDNYGHWQDFDAWTAWMPLPEPYKDGEQNG